MILLIIVIQYIFFSASLFAQTNVMNRRIIEKALIKNSAFTFDFDVSQPTFYNGKIYCIDYSQQKICVLENSNIIQTFGKKGRGPGEFQNINGFRVDNDGLSVIDGVSHTITEFDHKGVLKKVCSNKDLATMTQGLKLGVAGKFLIKPTEPLDNGQEVFYLVDINKDSKQKIVATTQFDYNKIANSPISFVVTTLLDGAFYSNNEGYIFRISFRSGEFLAFDNTTGKILYGRKTIDASQFADNIPQATNKSGEVMQVQIDLRGIRVVNISATVNKNYLFILSNAKSPSIKESSLNVTDDRIIDIYKVENGDYKYSLLLPKHNNKRATGCAVEQNSLFVVYGNEIVQFELKLP